jgi:hypothetical protein
MCQGGDITRPTRSKFRSAQSSVPAMTQSRPEPHSCSGRGWESASAISISVANLVHCRAKSTYAALAHGLVAAAANSAQPRARARHPSGSPGMADPHRRVPATPGCYKRLPARKSSKKAVSAAQRARSLADARDINHSGGAKYVIEHWNIDATLSIYSKQSDNARSHLRPLLSLGARGVACARRRSTWRGPAMTWSTSRLPWEPRSVRRTICEKVPHRGGAFQVDDSAGPASTVSVACSSLRIVLRRRWCSAVHSLTRVSGISAQL